jgi:hypothetical protein
VSTRKFSSQLAGTRKNRPGREVLRLVVFVAIVGAVLFLIRWLMRL